MTDFTRCAPVLTIGHSTLSYEAFLRLIRSAGVTAVADVRSAPYSRHLPHFNRDVLQGELKLDGVAYVFLGNELGGRPREPHYFCDGVADYERMAEAPSFKAGLGRVIAGAQSYRIALMCSEQNPLDCHRCLLVGRALKTRGMSVEHLLPSGELLSQFAIEHELLAMAGDDDMQNDLLSSPDDRLARAYRLRSKKAAYADRSSERERIWATS
jgi:uncharacterized protein (DUF488 family)